MWKKQRSVISVQLSAMLGICLSDIINLLMAEI